MLWALGAVTTALDALQSLTAAKSQPQTGLAAGNPFEVQNPSTSTSAASSSFTPATPGSGSIAPETMNALLDAQGQSATGSTAANSRMNSLKDLFSQIDADGDGKITKSEFEKALGAGGTNLAQADDVFSKLDANAHGSVDVGEMGKALLGSHHGHHHHAARSGGTGAGGTDNTGGQSGNPADALMSALDNASSSTVTNSDGSTTTTYGDGRTVTSSAQSNAFHHAVSTYASFEQLMRQNSAALSSSSTGSALLV